MEIHRKILIPLMTCWVFVAALAGGAALLHLHARFESGVRTPDTIVLEGTPGQIAAFSRWLDQIAEVPHGARTLERIAASGHRLVIQHADHVLLSAGRTVAPMSANLINGQGEGVQILFNAHIPDGGSHMVLDGRRQLIAYTAVHNLYHELAHAMHMMNGTWRYFNSERQAIEEENRFRRELAALRGHEPAYRMRKSGVLISDVAHTVVLSEWFGPSLVNKGDIARVTGKVASSGVALHRSGWRQRSRSMERRGS